MTGLIAAVAACVAVVAPYVGRWVRRRREAAAHARRRDTPDRV